MSIIIKNLKKSFDKKSVFYGFSCVFDDKGVYALIGESGVGKTTLLRMISGLDKDFSGEIIGAGIGKVSFAFQEYRLFPNLSAIDNVTLGENDSYDEAKKLLTDMAFSSEDMNLYPHEMSGGMKQRASLARAFLKKCPVLLLDEPTKELDKDCADTVIDIIKKEATERLVIVVTHRIEDVQRLGAKTILIQ